MRLTSKWVLTSALLVFSACTSQNPERGSSKATGFYAMVDTSGATGRDSMKVHKLSCYNKQTNSDSLTVLPNDPDTALVVDGHRLEIPSGSVPRANGATFRMTHLADRRELRLRLETVPEIRHFDKRINLLVSYESCDTAGVDLDAVQLLRNDHQLRGGRHDRPRRRVRAELWDLSTYSLVVP